MKIEKEFDELKRESRYLSEIIQYILHRCPTKGTMDDPTKYGYKYKHINPLLEHAFRIQNQIAKEWEKAGFKPKTRENILEENNRIQSGEQVDERCAYCGIVISYDTPVGNKKRLCWHCKRSGRKPYVRPT